MGESNHKEASCKNSKKKRNTLPLSSAFLDKITVSAFWPDGPGPPPAVPAPAPFSDPAFPAPL